MILKDSELEAQSRMAKTLKGGTLAGSTLRRGSECVCAELAMIEIRGAGEAPGYPTSSTSSRPKALGVKGALMDLWFQVGDGTTSTSPGVVPLKT